jgi:sirohydrochlorin cobaltochelatase
MTATTTHSAEPGHEPSQAPGKTSGQTAGLILFAHGARDPRWAAPFEAVAQRVMAARPQAAVRLAFLEFMTPGLVQAGAELVAAGCTQVAVLPMFLGAGGHVRKDLPLLMDEMRAAHPAVSFALHSAVGEIDSVVAAMASVAQAALDPQLPAPARENDRAQGAA